MLVIMLHSYMAASQVSAGFYMEGQVAVTSDGRGVFTNFGGPGLKFHFNPFTLSFQMMPSLRFQNEVGRPLVTPMLGVGPQLYLLKNKRLVLSFPSYYTASDHTWTFTAGLGYVLTNKNHSQPH